MVKNWAVEKVRDEVKKKNVKTELKFLCHLCLFESSALISKKGVARFVLSSQDFYGQSHDLALQLDCKDFKSEIAHIHFANLQVF